MQKIHTKNSYLRRALNRALDVLFMKPFLPFWRWRLNGKAMVYLYHRIGEQHEHHFLDKGGSPITSAAELRHDLQSLQRLGAEFIRFSDLAKCDYQSTTFYVVICADDGFACNYRAGMEVLEELGVPATIFQCSGMTASSDLIWEHKLYYLYFHPVCATAFKSYLDSNYHWPQSCDDIRETIHPLQIETAMADFLQSQPQLASTVKELVKELYPAENMIVAAQARGHEIASHGDRHFKRSLISDEEFVNELQVSSQKLSKILGNPVKAFSYPFNSYRAGDNVRCAKVYSLIATVDGGPVDGHTKLLQIPRNTFPGRARNVLRHRRWLLTGRW